MNRISYTICFIVNKSHSIKYITVNKDARPHCFCYLLWRKAFKRIQVKSLSSSAMNKKMETFTHFFPQKKERLYIPSVAQFSIQMTLPVSGATENSQCRIELCRTLDGSRLLCLGHSLISCCKLSL